MERLINEDMPVSPRQKLKIRLREIAELLSIVGCGIPIGLSIFEGLLVLSPAVLLILGAFVLAALAHFSMTNTWDGNCRGSFCYKNEYWYEWFCVGKIAILILAPIVGVFAIFLGLLQVVNPAVALVLGTISVATFIYHALSFWNSDKNKANSNDAHMCDFDFSEKKWLKFISIMYPIACALLLLSALYGVLPLMTALICCIPFGGIGLFTVICFLWSKCHKSKKELVSKRNDGINRTDEFMEQQAIHGFEEYNNISNEVAPQNQFNNQFNNQFSNMSSQQYLNNKIDSTNNTSHYPTFNKKPGLQTLEKITRNQEYAPDPDRSKLKDKNSNGTGNPSQEQKGYYNINEI